MLGFIRTAIGTQTAPPNQVLVGIALFLTLFVMAPTFGAIKTVACEPLVHHQISTLDGDQARRGAAARVHVQADAHQGHRAVREPGAPAARRRRAPTSPPTCSIPAFIISELKTAFQIGFLIFLPFLIIDMIVSSTLMSMGMMMLPPVVHLAAVQDPAVRPGRRLGPDHALARRELPLTAMNQDTVVNLATQAMTLALKVGGPILLAGLVIGLVVSIFQAVT